jgi:drug/metabolite transporter (DMT)-like permease
MHRWGVLLYLLLCVIWGSTWLVIKIGYGGLGPFNVASVRFFVAGTVMAAAAWMTGARWPRGRVEWTAVAVVGLLMFAADYGLIYWAEQYIESGLTSRRCRW